MSARYDLAVQEAFYWGEKLDNGASFADFGEVCSPGIDAALSGFWRGRNRADNEDMEDVKQTREDKKRKDEQKKRYSGTD